MWKGGAHRDLGSSNVTVQCVAMVLLLMICSNSWCSLLGLATTTYNTCTRKTTSKMGPIGIHAGLCEGGPLLSPRSGQQVSPAHQADSRFPLSTAQTLSHWPEENIRVWLCWLRRSLYECSSLVSTLKCGPTPRWLHIHPAPGRRWWMTEEYEHHYPPPASSPSLCWLFRPCR